MASDSVPAPMRQHRWLHGAVAALALILLLTVGNTATVAAPAPAMAFHRLAAAPATGTAPDVSHAAAPTPAATSALPPMRAAYAAAPGVPAARRVPTFIRPTAPPPPVAAIAPVVASGPRNYLSSADGTLHTGVGRYSDCSGRTVLSHAVAAIETCVRGRTYFVGHNPGVFTPLFHMGVGSIITWYDGAGAAHRLQIIGVRTWHRFAGVPPLLPGAIAEFQTCISADGTVDRLMDAAAG